MSNGWPVACWYWQASLCLPNVGSNHEDHALSTSPQGSADLDVAGSRRTSTYGELDPEVEYAGTTKASSLPGLIGNALGLRIPHVGGPAYQAASGAKAGPHTFKWVRS